jgi:hypothetical protein
MNIHCSACGAPLPTGARFCTSCALPLTAIAMPTPAPRRKRVSILAIVLAAFGIFWVVAYASDRYAIAHNQPQPAAMPALTPEQVKAAEAIDARMEREIDAEIWNSPERLRERITLLSLSTDPSAKRTIARLDARLKALQRKAAQ